MDLAAGQSQSEAPALENIDDDDFQLHELPHFPFLLTEDEKSELELWGQHAQSLSRGQLAPRNEKDLAFVRFCNSYDQPKTRFQRLWLKYCQAAKAERIYELFKELTERDSVKEEDFERLKSDVRRLNIAHTAAWGEVEKLKSELQAAKELHASTERALRSLVRKYEEQLGLSSPIDVQKPTEVEGWVDDWREQK
jgi:uncharacterized protein YifE (UPF0438 family)